jgi:RNA polymerase sigma-70 factor (ECF subfamily)
MYWDPSWLLFFYFRRRAARAGNAWGETMDDRGAQAERKLREKWERGDYQAVATLALEAYASEIMGFLVERLRGEDDASEVFSQFALDFWRGLPGFEWRSSLRAWAYALARNAANRHVRAPRRRHEQSLTLAHAHGVLDVAERLRSETLLYLRSSAKARVRTLREALSCDDQLLVTLRVDKQMTWPEIALVLEEFGDGAERASVTAAAARVRQRFQTVKARLRTLARQHGIVGE